MQPGQATYRPPEFPEAWCGLWKDNYGKLMYLKRISGRHLAVSFTAGLHRPFYPLPTVRFGSTHRLPALYQHDPQGLLYLKVEAGEPDFGPAYEVQFIFGEGDRLRPAEPTDLVDGVIARPRLSSGLSDEVKHTELSWAHPLSNFWKADELEAEFLASIQQ